jgi:hypothetical protein
MPYPRPSSLLSRALLVAGVRAMELPEATGGQGRTSRLASHPLVTKADSSRQPRKMSPAESCSTRRRGARRQ